MATRTPTQTTPTSLAESLGLRLAVDLDAVAAAVTASEQAASERKTRHLAPPPACTPEPPAVSPEAQAAADAIVAASASIHEARQRMLDAAGEFDDLLFACRSIEDSDEGLTKAIHLRNALKAVAPKVIGRDQQDQLLNEIVSLEWRIKTLKEASRFSPAEPSFLLRMFEHMALPKTNGYRAIREPVRVAEVARLDRDDHGRRLVEYVRANIDGGKLPTEGGREVIVLPSIAPREERKMVNGVEQIVYVGNGAAVVDGAYIVRLTGQALDEFGALRAADNPHFAQPVVDDDPWRAVNDPITRRLNDRIIAMESDLQRVERLAVTRTTPADREADIHADAAPGGAGK